MNLERATHLLTLFANLGVIIGIIFLALEMQQTSAIATAQYRLDYAAGWRSVDETRQEEAFSKVLTKSIESPEELSLTELIRLDAYYSGILDQLLSAQTARTTGLVDGEFSEIAKIIGKIYFSNEFARAWWRQVRTDWVSGFNSDFQAVLDEAILNVENGRAERIFEGILNELSEEQ